MLRKKFLPVWLLIASKLKAVLLMLVFLLVSFPALATGENAKQQIAAGESHTVMLKSDGTLWAWGSNDFGQLGYGTAVFETSPGQVGTDKRWTSVAAGSSHTVALRADGTLWAWGNNDYGQLGCGSYGANRTSPVQVGTDNKWVSVAAGGYHTVAIKADGTLWGWGRSSEGQLGSGSPISVIFVPEQIGTDNRWTAVAAGIYHTIALRSDGTLWGMGMNVVGQLGNGTNINAFSPAQIGADTNWAVVQAGWHHTIALKSNGTLWTWGYNAQGQLGEGTNINAFSPVQIETDTKWTAVRGGLGYSVALKSDGTAWAWGLNDFGQLGDGTNVNKTVPSQIGTDVDWISIDAGGSHNVALKSDGTLWTWGRNGSGQLGDGRLITNMAVPEQITAVGAGWIKAAAGWFHTAALKSNGTLWTWGGNNFSQLGNGTNTDTVVPTQIGTDSNWASISAGDSHTIALKSNGTMWSWGANFYGSLGDGTSNSQNSPVQIGINADWACVAASGDHTAALKANGTLWAWGANDSAQLGDGTTVYKNSPVQIGTDNDWASVAPGFKHTAALKSDGTLWAWGHNQFGQLGNGSNTNTDVPTRIGADSNWAAISAGDYHTIALKSNGTLWAWGLNQYGQLGDGTIVYKNYPVQIGTDTDWVSIATGFNHVIALKSDGTLWGWGRNVNGQVGGGTNTDQVSPVRIGTDADWKSIAAHGDHSVAIKSYGTMWTWGFNQYGQLGDGTTTDKNNPSGIGVPILSYSVEAGYGADGVDPDTGSTSANFTYKVVYTDPDNSAPVYIKTCVDWSCSAMSVDAGADLPLRDGNYANGEQYVYWTNLAIGSHNYYFEASDGIISARLPSSGMLSGPTVSYIAISTTTLDGGTVGTAYSHTMTASGGVAPYTWSVPAGGLPPGLTIAPLSGIISGTPTGFGTYQFTVQVTDSNFVSASRSFSIDINPLSIASTSSTASVLGAYFSQAFIMSGGVSPCTWSILSGALPPGLTLDHSTGVISGFATAPGTYAFTIQVTDANLYTNTRFSVIKVRNNAGSTVWGWGSDGFGALGNGLPMLAENTPVQIDLAAGMVSIAAGDLNSGHALGLKEDGTVWAWGYNQHGQLGDGTTNTGYTPVRSGSLTDVIEVSAGAYHSLALKSDGTVWAWGSNQFGQLGNGTVINSSVPVQVSNLQNVVAISSGGEHSLALKNDGTVWAWGQNYFGQLGDHSSTHKNIPVQIWLYDIVALAGGGTHSLALKNDGTVWAWGSNPYGALGDGTGTDKNYPVPVAGMTNVADIAGANLHSLFLKGDGTVWAAGLNYYGQIGDGTNVSRPIAVQVSGLTGVVAIEGGINYSLALKNDGTVWAWGDGSFGKLGDGAALSRTTPVQATGITNAVGIAAGGDFSFALVPAPLSIETVSLPSGLLGSAYGTTLSASGGNPPYKWSVTSGLLPSGLTLSPNTGVISGTIDAPQGNYAFTVSVVDSRASTVGKALSIRVNDAVPPSGTISINNGAAGTGSLSVALTLSAVDAHGTVVQMRFSNDGTTWSAWEGYAVSKQWIMPQGEGIKTVYAQFMDDSGNISAIAQDSITYSVTIDLIVSSLSGPSTAYTSTSIAVANTVSNQGTVSSSTSIVKFYLSTDAVIDANDTYLGQRSINSLAGGAASSATTSVSIPLTVAAGTYYIGAIADAGNTNTESDEANNTASTAAVTVTSGVDLIVSSISGPASAVTGANITVPNTVKNQGGGGAVSSTLKFYLSTDNIIDSTDTSIGQRSVNSLSAGATNSNNTVLAIPVSLAPGTYYIGAVADSANANPESDETNNTASTAAVTITSGVDLVVTSMSGPASAVTGSVMTVTNTVKNQGAGASVLFVVKFYLSSDATIDASDIYIGQRTVSGLASGASNSQTTSLTIPVTTALGSYYIGAIADASNTNPESDETNNTASTTAVAVTSGIDLVVSSITAPGAAVTGSNISVPNTVKNQGTGAATTSTLKFYLSTDTVIDSTDTYLGQRTVNGLSGGATSSATTTLAIPVSVAAGNYYIGAIADSANTNPESDEANNTASSTSIAITSGIDLIVSSLSGPATAVTGSSISVVNAVKNQGTGAASSSVLKFYLSTDSIIDSTDTYLGQRTVSGLSGGAVSSATTTVTLPVSTAPGNYYIGAIADSTNANPESDETNNTASTAAMTVTSGIDLIVSSLSGPASAQTGATITVPNTVKNQGTGNATTSTLKFYLSADSIIDSSDISLGQRTVNGLAAGATSSYNTNLTIPLSVSAGTYYIGAVADASSTNLESDETNNSALTAALNITSGVDLLVSSISGPASAVTGAVVTVSNAVKNQGNGTSALSTIKFYLSTDTLIDATDIYLGQRSVSGLSGGVTSSANTSLTIPVSTAAGTYYIGAIADAANANPESDETNNTASTAAVTVTSGIDLVVSSLTGPATAVTGASMTVANTVKNQGTGTATTSTVKFYLSTDSNIDSTDLYLGQRTVNGLSAGAASSANTSLMIPVSTAAGTYYIGAIADAANANPESDEGNNTAVSSAVTVTSGIDIVVSSITGPSTAVAGTSATVNNAVKNQGAGTSVISTLKFYLSSDPVIDSTDVYIGQRSVGGLSGGATSSANTNLTIPVSTSAGTYYIGAIADSGGTNPESDEGNNTGATGAVVISAAP